MMTKHEKPRAVLIAGPTASGKSALALALAERFGGTVINADSMQVYRELSILTARPLPEQEARAPHSLYGHVSAAEPYSVARWLEEARASIGGAERAGRLPIIVGGTGLYFDALTRGLAEVPAIPAELRERLRGELAEDGVATLHLRLAALDPVMAARLKPSDPQRVLRALEVVTATGRSLDAWQRDQGIKPALPLEACITFVLNPPRDALYDTINARFLRMMEEGAVEEVRTLEALGLPATAPVLKALGVQPLGAMISGQFSDDQAIQSAQTASRHYAKRQLTWFRNKFMSWNWFTEKFSERIIEDILRFMPQDS